VHFRQDKLAVSANHVWLGRLVNEVIMLRTAAFLGSLLIVASIAEAAFHCSANRAARAEFAELARELPGLATANVRTDPWRGMTIEGLTFRRGGLRFEVGRINLPFATPQSFFVSAAQAQDIVAPTGTISAENIEIDVGPMHYTIKRIELSGTSLTKADLEAIVDPKSMITVADRIGKLSASQIKLPEIAMETTLTGQTERDSYRDITLNDVVHGHVGSLVIGALTSNLTSPEAGTMQTTYGPTKMTGLDVVLAARVISEARKSDDEPLTTLYKSLEIASSRILMEKSNLEIDMGGLSAKDMKARPLRIPPTTAVSLLAAPDADSNRRLNDFVADVLDSFEVGKLDVTDLRLTVTDKDAPGTGTLGRFYLSQMAHSKIMELGFENLGVEAQGSTVKIGSVNLHDIDLIALRDLAKSSNGQFSGAAHPRASIASEVDLNGIDVDAAEAKTAGGRHTRFKLSKLDLISTDPVDGIPTHFSTVIDHFILDLHDLSGSQLDDVAALGYDKIDLSSRLDAHFDASKQELGVDELSLSGIDMGVVKIACSFGNVSKDLFSADQAQIEAAALSVLIHRVEIRVENSGLFERLIAQTAKNSNKSLDQVREAYVAAAALGVPALLGDGPAARAIGTAVAKFIAAPRNLRIVAVARDGLGAADLALIQNPNALMNKLSVEAAADE
jgi:hypothetical protein